LEEDVRGMAILFLLSFLPCVGWWLWRKEKNLSVSIYDPIIAFSIYYGIFFFLGGAIIVSQEMYLYDVTYGGQAIIETYIGFLVFELCVLMSYGVFGRNADSIRFGNAGEDCRKWVTLNHKQLFLIGAAILVPATLSAWYMVRLIAQYGLVEYTANRIVITSGKGYFLLPLKWFLSYLLVYWVNRLAITVRTRKRSLGIGALLIALLASAAGVVQASRSRALIPFLIMIGLWMILRRPGRSRVTPILVVLMCACGLVVVGVFLGDVRGRIASGSADVVGGASKPMDLRRVVLGLNNLRAVENTIWLVENMRDKDVMFGSTFLAVATAVVPRVVWEDKPLGGGPSLRNLISPGSYDLVSGENLTSYSPGIVTEGYLNFGFSGFIVTGITFGILLAILARCYSWVRGPIGFAMWIYSLYALLGMLTGEVFGTVAAAFSILLPMAMIYPISRIMSEMKRGIAKAGYRM
jgi:hypothetical protein